ncbi:ATPase domain-containing protein [Pseudoduganella sp. UC29_71]|uniref:ATPase domain-containing protein n=1 Tax=Pseudoduganella sp. UC29_71 TaxID=3350174 RepID=UPI00366B74A3
MNNKVNIQRLSTGVPGLDELLGGGIPEYSFNLLAGTPGSGKTTLAHQIMFSLAGPERRALFFTVLGEPPLKMLRYQQQFAFFDLAKLNHSVKFVNLAAELLEGDFERVLARIADEVREFAPSLVFVDSFRSVAQSARAMEQGGAGLQKFVQRLGMQMTSWLATTFLIGEYLAPEAESSPVFTVADGIIWMSQLVQRDTLLRKIQVVKMRGQAQSLGVHTFRICDTGVEIFPRAMIQEGAAATIASNVRLSMGVPELDTMLGGGLPAGYSMLVVGPSGSGKSVLATQFLSEGVRVGEAGVIAAFEKSPNQLLSRQLDALIESGRVGMINTRTLDLSIDAVLADMVALIKQLDAKRMVIDSLSSFELALASSSRDDFRQSLYRMVAVLTAMGVTVLMTAELEDRYDQLSFSSYGNAFLADAIIMHRYVELDGQFKRVLSVVKVRASAHSKDIRFYDIGSAGMKVGPEQRQFQGILTGRPVAPITSQHIDDVAAEP